ncbi:replication protein [Pantoea sp. X85]|uniref:replication protein n=1 Tax=Pantoea sp. X85 TaxID=3037258 RepID=UPI002413A024|nr:replication protein [Pantoea sp. X85]WFL66400.1 replication protein [Pantoea sp. X85]
MNNVAYANFGANQQPVERRVVDIDDGYTKVANELLEAIASADLTARQLKIMLAYMRKTYGFNKKSDRIADEQISAITGISRQNVNKAKKELLEMNCLFRNGNQIGINKEVSAWHFSKSLQVSNLVSNLETKKVSNLETARVSKSETHKRHSLNTKENTPLTPQGGDSDLAQECLDFYNQTTDSRCSSTAPFEKALSTVKAKGVCYSAEEVKLVTEWAFKVWKNKPSPNNLCRMTRFDTYLSDALKWNDCTERNPAPCPHDELVNLWNAKFPERAVESHEWNKSRPAYRGMERVWNGKTNNGAWREVKHIATVFDLIRKSKLCDGLHEKTWLTLDWILDAKNWAKVYEQARREYKQSKQGVMA